MQRYDSESSARIRVLIPSFFVQQPSIKLPPPIPGRVELEDLQDKSPEFRFICPWPGYCPTNVTNREDIVDWGCDPHNPIPCEVDRKILAKYLEKYPVGETLSGIFAKCAESGPNAKVCADIIASLEAPFTSAKRQSDQDPLVWTLVKKVQVDPTIDTEFQCGPKKSTHRNRRVTQSSVPWSIQSFLSGPPARPRNVSGDDGPIATDFSPKEQRDALEEGSTREAPVVRKNVIYNGDGVAIALVDFGHGISVGTHAHSLAEHNLAHVSTQLEDHLFHFVGVPWPWMCIPIDPSFLFSNSVVKSFFATQPNEGRTDKITPIPTETKKEANRLSSRSQPNFPSTHAAETNPFAAHFPADRFLSYRCPTTIDWDLLKEPSWRWLAIDLPHEDFSSWNATGTS